MNAGISVVIIDTDLNSLENIKTHLKKTEGLTVEGEACQLLEGYEMLRQKKPAVVIMELAPSLDEALTIVERITHNFPQTSVFVTSSDVGSKTVIRCMRAGANEFLTRPVNSGDLSAAIQRLGSKLLKNHEEENAKGRIISFFSYKGGVGTTTVATNTACAMAQKNDSVVIVDLCMDRGDVCTFLNVKPRYTLTDVTKNISRLDSSFLESVLTTHSSGVRILAKPNQEDVEFIAPSQVSYVLTLLKSMSQYVIVDTLHTFDKITLTALDLSDTVLVVSDFVVPTIGKTKQCLDVFHRLGYKDKIKVIMNRYLSSNQVIDPKSLKEFFGYPSFQLINNDYDASIKAINRGVPIQHVAANSGIAANFRELACKLDGAKRSPEKEKSSPWLVRKINSIGGKVTKVGIAK